MAISTCIVKERTKPSDYAQYIGQDFVTYMYKVSFHAYCVFRLFFLNLLRTKVQNVSVGEPQIVICLGIMTINVTNQ